MYVYVYIYIYIYILYISQYPRLSHPRSGDSQGPETILTFSADKHIHFVIDRAHRIGSRYLGASSNHCKSIIIRFTTLHHRTMFYRVKNKLKKGVIIKLNLTKSRYDLLKRANDHVKEVPSIKFYYADLNCRLKVKFNDENQKDIFFASFDDLRDNVDMEI